MLTLSILLIPHYWIGIDMYFRGWIHSWTCGDCPDADSYWRLRAFWSGRQHRRSATDPPKRCPDRRLWAVMWLYGDSDAIDELEF